MLSPTVPDRFVEFEEPVDLGDGWVASGFWCRAGPLVPIQLEGPEKRSLEARLNLVQAMFVDDVPCSPSSRLVERLVLAISCELSSSTLTVIE